MPARKFRITIPSDNPGLTRHSFILDGDFINVQDGGFVIGLREPFTIAAAYAPGTWLTVEDVTDDD